MTHEVSRNRCPWDTFKESNYREEEKKPLHIAKATIDVYNYKNIIIKKKKKNYENIEIDRWGSIFPITTHSPSIKFKRESKWTYT